MSSADSVSEFPPLARTLHSRRRATYQEPTALSWSHQVSPFRLVTAGTDTDSLGRMTGPKARVPGETNWSIRVNKWIRRGFMLVGFREGGGICEVRNSFRKHAKPIRMKEATAIAAGVGGPGKT